MPKLVYIVTVPLSARAFLRGQLGYFRDRGFDVLLISSPGSDLQAAASFERVTALAVPMQREIDVRQDLVSLWRLYRLLRELQPDVVNATTPKAGLLGLLAAWFARVPIRIYFLVALRLETLSGGKRFVLSVTEWIAAACASRVVCNSESLRQVYVSLGLAPVTKTLALANGSANGLEARRFLPSVDTLRQSQTLREQLGIPEKVPVIGFVGRLTKDKGIVELLDAFEKVLESSPHARLLLLGRLEEGDPIPTSYAQRLEAHRQVVMTGYVIDTAPYYHLMDLFVFPSYREGFGNVLLEAGAAGVPVVAFRATGVVDAVLDGVTGTLVPIGDVEALVEASLIYLNDPDLGRQHGQAGRERVLRDFRRETVWKAWHTEYVRLLQEKGLPIPKPPTISEVHHDVSHIG